MPVMVFLEVFILVVEGRFYCDFVLLFLPFLDEVSFRYSTLFVYLLVQATELQQRGALMVKDYYHS